ncbi:hypothetical protein QFC20_006796 [Naganishia adeliensis]|uniref:Uncharacterized protein n=1 Tax=Naganishia adeliensis TaxID=92952 RepID=A0ACC2V6C1_9TREE|nr:hypothetical protein QFC20_006796 [Naganishia adeliensis]
MKLSALLALPLVTAVSRTGIPSFRDLDLTSGFLQALLPRQDDPRVEYPELSTCFRLCFDNEISKINEADIEKALAFGVQFCQAGGVEVTPTVSSVVPTSTGGADLGPSSAGNGIGTIPAGSTTLIAVDATSDLVPAESTPAVPSSITGTSAASTDSVVQSSSQVAASSIVTTASNAASSVKSSASSAVSSAAATASQSNAARGLIAPSGLIAGVLAVVLAL